MSLPGREGAQSRMEFLPHLYGQPRLKRDLSRLMREQRLAHTMIFYGDEGLGKTTAALDLAGAVTRSGAYGEITAQMEDGARAKDPAFIGGGDTVWYLRPSGQELKVDQLRLFLDAMPSFDERPHVCIIDEAQTMMPAAANTMLKTLEEPAANVYFILITPDLEALLPTIVSRGERFPFFPLSREDYLHLLQDESGKYGVPSGKEAEAAFLLSEGNPGVTLDMFGEGGAGQPMAAMDFWDLVSRGRAPFSEWMEKAPLDRKEFGRMLRWMTWIGRDLMILSEVPGAGAVRCGAVYGREKAAAPCWGGGRAEQALEVLKKAEAARSRYISVKNIWDMILISLIRIREER